MLTLLLWVQHTVDKQGANMHTRLTNIQERRSRLQKLKPSHTNFIARFRNLTHSPRHHSTLGHYCSCSTRLFQQTSFVSNLVLHVIPTRQRNKIQLSPSRVSGGFQKGPVRGRMVCKGFTCHVTVIVLSTGSRVKGLAKLARIYSMYKPHPSLSPRIYSCDVLPTSSLLAS